MRKSDKKNKSNKKLERKTNKTISVNAATAFFNKPWQDLLCIAVLTLIALAPILSNSFVTLDDRSLIYENPIIIYAEISRAFNWSLYTPFYKPVVFLTWIIEHKLFGFNPTVFHLNNLLIHICNCFLVYFITLKLSNNWFKPAENKYTLAFFTALLFGVHPIHVESVAWAVERKDVLFSAFYLFSFWSYIKFVDGRDIKWILIAAVSYLLSMMCKAPGITLIAVLFVYDYFKGRTINVKLITEKIPIIIVFFIGVWMYGLLFNFAEHTQTNVLDYQGDERIQTTASIAGLLLMNFKMLFWFLHTLIPVKLAVAYPRVEFLAIANSLKLILPLVTLVTAFLIWKLSKNKKRAIFFGLFFLITLSPPLVRDDYGASVFLSDRYMYLPAFSVIVFVLGTIFYIGNKFFPQLNNFVVIACSILSVGFIFSSFSNAKSWKNTETLWTNTIDKYPDIPFVLNNRGSYYLALENPQKALIDFNRSISIFPENDISYAERGRGYKQLKEYDKAIADFNKAIKINPKNVTAFLNRGNTYQEMNQFDKAMADYSSTLVINPNSLQCLVNRSALYTKMKNPTEALEDLNKVIELEPLNDGAIRNKIFALFDLGRVEEAIGQCDLFLSINPKSDEIYETRAFFNQRLGNTEKALSDINQAIVLNSARGRYYNARAAIYRAIGRTDLADKDAQTAARLGGN